jgi:hypothetical protein
LYDQSIFSRSQNARPNGDETLEAIERLSRTIEKRLRSLDYRSPSLAIIRQLLNIAYHATLKTEEGRFVRGSITFALPRDPDTALPLTIRADYPAFTKFGIRPPLTVELLVKLSRAIDRWAGSVAVYGTSANKLFCWGIVDQRVADNVQINREPASGFGFPGIVTINIDGVGELSVYHSHLFLGGLNGSEVTIKENDALNSRVMRARILPDVFPFAVAIAQTVHGQFDAEHVTDYTQQLMTGWSNTIARICIGLRRMGAGGSLLITPSPKLSDLEIAWPIEYPRVGDSLILGVLDNAYRSKTASFFDSTKDDVPRMLVIENRLADGDAEDRESELTGAVKLVTSFAAADGVVVMTPLLHVLGFGVKIGQGRKARRVYDGPEFSKRGVNAKLADTSRFGMRHASMLRYCRKDSSAIGIVVSQDGIVRIAVSSARSLTLWDNVKLLDHSNYSSRAARSEKSNRKYWSEHRNEMGRGYTDMPKTISELISSYSP